MIEMAACRDVFYVVVYFAYFMYEASHYSILILTRFVCVTIYVCGKLDRYQ